MTSHIFRLVPPTWGISKPQRSMASTISALEKRPIFRVPVVPFLFRSAARMQNFMTSWKRVKCGQLLFINLNLIQDIFAYFLSLRNCLFYFLLKNVILFGLAFPWVFSSSDICKTTTKIAINLVLFQYLGCFEPFFPSFLAVLIRPWASLAVI